MASLEMNVSTEMENTLENTTTIQNLILKMEELEKAKEHNEVKLAIFGSQYSEETNEV